MIDENKNDAVGSAMGIEMIRTVGQYLRDTGRLTNDEKKRFPQQIPEEIGNYRFKGMNFGEFTKLYKEAASHFEKNR
jgi:hypothetical protein